MVQIRFTKRFKSSWQTSWGGDHRLLYSTSGGKNHSWMKQQRHKLPTNTETRTASELKLSVKQVSVPRLSITYKNFNIISIPSGKKNNQWKITLHISKHEIRWCNYHPENGVWPAASSIHVGLPKMSINYNIKSTGK